MPRPVAAATKPFLQVRPAPPPESYAGSAACARCHADIYKSFLRTRMGRSLTPVTPAVVQTLALPASVYNQGLDRHYEVFSRNGKLFESEYQTAANGSEVFRTTQPVDWILGAGMSGINGLVKRGNFLFEAPLAFYSSANHWDLSPGYQASDLGFERAIPAGCISCHSGRPRPVDSMSGEFEPVPFAQAAIGCEKCHGPGEAHIRAMSAGSSRAHGSQIVNPGRLSADLENDICMNCHEAGDSRVPLPGKSFGDVRPGVPLGETIGVFMVPLSKDDKSEGGHVEHFFEMSMSKCYRATAGQLRCATCHDPHVEPAEAEAPAVFNAKCMGCHAGRACTAPIDQRKRTTPADNCIGCHMPRRDVPDTPHTSLTNHRILARAGEPWPEAAYQMTTQSMPDLVWVNRPAGHTEDPPPLTLLEA